jgi:hypothetical protein
MQLNINLSSDRFAMFNKQRDITTGYSSPGYGYAYQPVVRRHLYATTVPVRRHWRY